MFVPNLQLHVVFLSILTALAALVNKIISNAAPPSCSATKDFKSALNVAGVVFIHYITALCVSVAVFFTLQFIKNVLQSIREGFRFWQSDFVPRSRFGCFERRGF